MNGQRRKELAGIAGEVDDAIATLSEAKDRLETVRDEEQEAYDNLPESLQQGDQGQAMEAAVSALEDAISAIEELVDGDVVSAIETAQE